MTLTDAFDKAQVVLEHVDADGERHPRVYHTAV
jgi:hypothetical protein